MHQSGRPVCGGRETLASPRPQKIIRPAHTPLKSDFYNKIGQKRTHAPQQRASLLDHLVGDGEHPRRHLDAERLRRLTVDDELEFG